MRSAQLDWVFDDEEKEFLLELIEPAFEEGEEALNVHRQELDDPEEDVEDTLWMVDRQKRRMKFLQVLHACLKEV